MSTKSTKPKREKADFRYAPEDFAPRDSEADKAFVDAFLKRNREAINASIAKARAQIGRGDFFTHDQVVADLKAQRLRRRARKK